MANSGSLAQPAIKRGNTAKLISTYYLEIEYLLDRVEHSVNHYQVLGLERSATGEEIIQAYQQTVALLHPSYYKVRAAVPDEMLVRIDKIFTRVSQAMFVLTNPGKRTEYDETLHKPASNAAQACVVKPPAPIPVEHPSRRLDQAMIDIKPGHVEQPIYTKPVADLKEVNRRRCERFKLLVPAMVAGYDRTSGKWQEVTKTIDVSRVGVAVRLKMHVRHGNVLHVTLPLPVKLRSHGFSEAGYNMYAIVRRVEPCIDGVRVVGLEFLGSHPPSGYLYKPWASFRTPRWTGVERRREPREPLVEPVRITYLDEYMQAVGHEAAMTDNVSAGGARVLVKSAPAEFDFVKVLRLKGGFESLALVRNRYSGEDGFDRLCLQFKDKKWPM